MVIILPNVPDRSLKHFFRFDPYALLNGLRNKAIEMGVTIVKGDAVGFEAEETHMCEGVPGLVDSGYHKLKRVQVIPF